jgi:hypothetical protein
MRGVTTKKSRPHPMTIPVLLASRLLHLSGNLKWSECSWAHRAGLRIVVAHLGVVFFGFSAMGVVGWVMLIGSDPAMLSSKPCSSFCSFEVLERLRLLLEGTCGSAPRFFVAGCTFLWSSSTASSFSASINRCLASSTFRSFRRTVGLLVAFFLRALCLTEAGRVAEERLFGAARFVATRFRSTRFFSLRSATGFFIAILSPGPNDHRCRAS